MEHVTDLTGLAFVVLTALACGMLLAHFRQPPLVGYLLASVMMSQLGEFSFLLAAAGLAVAAISPEEAKLIISVTVLSLALSPFWLATVRRLQRVMERPFETWSEVITATFVGERAFFLRMVRVAVRLAGGGRSLFTRRAEHLRLGRDKGATRERQTRNLPSRSQ